MKFLMHEKIDRIVTKVYYNLDVDPIFVVTFQRPQPVVEVKNYVRYEVLHAQENS